MATNDKPPLAPAPVLFVEDDEHYAALIQHAWSRVQSNGPLQWFENGQKAIAYLQETASKAEAEPGLIPRMILTDLNMPVLNGFGLLKWVRQNPPFIELPVIILSGCSSKRDMEAAYALGADLCLEKPSDLRENVEMLRALNFWLETLTFSGRPLAGRSRM